MLHELAKEAIIHKLRELPNFDMVDLVGIVGRYSGNANNIEEFMEQGFYVVQTLGITTTYEITEKGKEYYERQLQTSARRVARRSDC